MRTPQKETVSVLKHPSQNFIVFLMLTKEPINTTLEALNLPVVPINYPQYLEAQLPPKPKQFDPENKFHKESVAYLKELGIYGLFHPDKYTFEAKSYFDNYDLKENIEQMLLIRKPMPFKASEIAKRINAKFDVLCTEDGIDRYRHYFWNVKVMKLSDWDKVFNNPAERARVKNSIKNSSSYTLAKLGFQVKMETKEMLREALGYVYLDMQDWAQKPVSSEKTKALSTIIGDITTIDDRLSNMDITMKETLKQFEKFKLEHQKSTIEGISATAMIGNYTESGMQLMEANIKDLEGKDEYVLTAHKEEE